MTHGRFRPQLFPRPQYHCAPGSAPASEFHYIILLMMSLGRVLGPDCSAPEAVRGLVEVVTSHLQEGGRPSGWRAMTRRQAGRAGAASFMQPPASVVRRVAAAGGQPRLDLPTHTPPLLLLTSSVRAQTLTQPVYHWRSRCTQPSPAKMTQKDAAEVTAASSLPVTVKVWSLSQYTAELSGCSPPWQKVGHSA